MRVTAAPGEGGRRQGGAGRTVAAFASLVALTALELGVFHLSGDRAARVTALAGLAMTKAAVVLAIFMDLRTSPRALKLAALLPLLLAPGFAVVLMLEAAFRARQG
jgi:cytochrome c oxidase subunit IV